MDKKFLAAAIAIAIIGILAGAYLVPYLINTDREDNSTCSCWNYNYSTCPHGCIPRCKPSSCYNVGGFLMCSNDCDGNGSCSCPI